MSNSADPDQLASSEANRSGSTVCKGRVYPGSAGQGFMTHQPLWAILCCLLEKEIKETEKLAEKKEEREK